MRSLFSSKTALQNRTSVRVRGMGSIRVRVRARNMLQNRSSVAKIAGVGVCAYRAVRGAYTWWHGLVTACAGTWAKVYAELVGLWASSP